MQELIEENARLEFEKKSSFNESATLEEELMRARSQMPGEGWKDYRINFINCNEECWSFESKRMK